MGKERKGNERVFVGWPLPNGFSRTNEERERERKELIISNGYIKFYMIIILHFRGI